jgi:histidinol phosphatase-like PHP family hydrolase
MTDNTVYLHRDFHVHTVYSPCAQPEMIASDIILTAKERGIRSLGFTDHVFGFTDPNILKLSRRDCPASDGDPEIFFGCEADVLCVGKTTVTQEMLDNLDYIMVAANHFNNNGAEMVDPTLADDPIAIGKHFLKMFNYATSLKYADVIAHPLFVMLDTYRVDSIYTLTETDLAPGIEAAAANGIAMEISRRATTPDQVEFLSYFYRLCKHAGVKFSVGSDAHTLDAVGQIHLIAPLIESLGLKDDDFWQPRKNLAGDK